MESKPHRKISNIFLQSDLQMSFALTFALSIFFTGIIYITIFYQFIVNYYDTIFSALHIPHDSILLLRDGFQQVLIVMSVFLITFTFVTFLMALRLSHRIVGPIHQLENAMKKTIETGKITEVNFRPKDFFHSLASTFNQYTKVLQRKD